MPSITSSQRHTNKAPTMTTSTSSSVTATALATTDKPSSFNIPSDGQKTDGQRSSSNDILHHQPRQRETEDSGGVGHGAVDRLMKHARIVSIGLNGSAVGKQF